MSIPTPEEIRLLRAVVAAARDVVDNCGSSLPYPARLLRDLGNALRSLDAYQPPVEPEPPCSVCGGTGARPGCANEACWNCQGTGKRVIGSRLCPAAQDARRPRPPGELVDTLPDVAVQRSKYRECGECSGMGKVGVYEVGCARCDGTGRVVVARAAKVMKVKP